MPWELIILQEFPGPYGFILNTVILHHHVTTA